MKIQIKKNQINVPRVGCFTINKIIIQSRRPVFIELNSSQGVFNGRCRLQIIIGC